MNLLEKARNCYDNPQKASLMEQKKCEVVLKEIKPGKNGNLKKLHGGWKQEGLLSPSILENVFLEGPDLPSRCGLLQK